MVKSRRLRWAGHVARMEEERSAFKILTGKPTGNKLLRRPRRRWEDDVRVDLKEICINTRSAVDFTQDTDYWRALVNATLNVLVPFGMQLNSQLGSPKSVKTFYSESRVLIASWSSCARFSRVLYVFSGSVISS